MSARTFIAPPVAIGEQWPGMGGMYAGLVRGTDGKPDQHLILAAARPENDLPWKKACDWASAVEADGHSDFTLPGRSESALLFANLKDQFEPRWHWTSEQYYSSYAWFQAFYGGGQAYIHKSYEGRAVAVRRFDVWSFNPSEVSA